MYSITVESARKLVRVELSGFFSVEEVAAFARDEQAAVAGMGCTTGEYLLLIDASGSKIQTQEVIADFQAFIANSPLKARRLAIVVGGSAARMQVRRILARDTAMIVCTRREGEAWLFGDEDAAAA